MNNNSNNPRTSIADSDLVKNVMSILPLLQTGNLLLSSSNAENSDNNLFQALAGVVAGTAPIPSQQQQQPLPATPQQQHLLNEFHQTSQSQQLLLHHIRQGHQMPQLLQLLAPHPTPQIVAIGAYLQQQPPPQTTPQQTLQIQEKHENKQGSSSEQGNQEHRSTNKDSSVYENASSHPRSFPWKLYEMLDDAETTGFTHVVSWADEGKSFKVHIPDTFVDLVMPKYFNQTKYKSFQRQLNLYGFHRTNEGVRKGVCKHKFFIRGQRHLLKQLTRSSALDEKLTSINSTSAGSATHANDIDITNDAAASNNVITNPIPPTSPSSDIAMDVARNDIASSSCRDESNTYSGRNIVAAAAITASHGIADMELPGQQVTQGKMQNYTTNSVDKEKVYKQAASSSVPTNTGKRIRRKDMKFLFKLHDMLEKASYNSNNDGFEHIVSWQPGNKSFKIHNPEQFQSQILPVFISYKMNYTSFLDRLVTRYGFSIIENGPSKGGYYHVLFIRNKNDLWEQLLRQSPSSSKRSTHSSSKRCRSSDRVDNHKDASYDNHAITHHTTELFISHSDFLHRGKTTEDARKFLRKLSNNNDFNYMQNKERKGEDKKEEEHLKLSLSTLKCEVKKSSSSEQQQSSKRRKRPNDETLQDVPKKRGDAESNDNACSSQQEEPPSPQPQHRKTSQHTLEIPEQQQRRSLDVMDDEDNDEHNDEHNKSNNDNDTTTTITSSYEKVGNRGVEGLSWRQGPFESGSDWTIEVVRKRSGLIDTYHVHEHVVTNGPIQSKLIERLIKKEKEVHNSNTNNTSLSMTNNTYSMIRIELDNDEADVFDVMLDKLYSHHLQQQQLLHGNGGNDQDGDDDTNSASNTTTAKPGLFPSDGDSSTKTTHDVESFFSLYNLARRLEIKQLMEILADEKCKHMVIKDIILLLSAKEFVQDNILLEAAINRCAEDICSLEDDDISLASKIEPTILLRILRKNIHSNEEKIKKTKKEEKTTQGRNTDDNDYSQQSSSSCTAKRWSQLIAESLFKTKKNVTDGDLFLELTSKEYIPDIDEKAAIKLLVCDAEFACLFNNNSSNCSATDSRGNDIGMSGFSSCLEERCITTIHKNWTKLRIELEQKKELRNLLHKLPSFILTEILMKATGTTTTPKTTTTTPAPSKTTNVP